MRLTKLSALALMLLTTAAQAQTEVPAALADVQNLSPKGQVLGFDAWGSPGQEFLWLHDPKTGTIIAGFPFGADGQSLNAEHTGEKAVTLSTFIAQNTPAYAPPMAVDEAGNVSVSLPDNQLPEVEALLAKLDDAARDKAMAALVDALRPVKSEAEFNTAVGGWVESLRNTPASGEAMVEAKAEPAPATAAEAKAASEGKTLLQAMQEAFLLEVGKPEAPRAYALIDPSHAPSIAALKELKPQIESGELRLSLLLLPASSEDAAGIVAGVLMSDDPVATLFAMAEAPEGGAETPFRRFADLPDEAEEGVRRNYALAVAYELPALPFFGFLATEGERYIKGIPAFTQFEGIGAAPAEGVTPVSEPAPEPAQTPAPTEAEADPAAPAE